MSDEMIAFITHWEVENYRAKVAEASASQKRFEGKVAVVRPAPRRVRRGIASTCRRRRLCGDC